MGENARRQHLTAGKAGHVTAGVRMSKPGLKVTQQEKDNETTTRLACRVSANPIVLYVQTGRKTKPIVWEIAGKA